MWNRLNIFSQVSSISLQTLYYNIPINIKIQNMTLEYTIMGIYCIIKRHNNIDKSCLQRTNELNGLNETDIANTFT